MPASPPPPEAPDQPQPSFVLGFAFLKDQMGPLLGDPVEFEHGNPDNCDTQQLTTTGLAYWRCDTNLLSFVAYPDGQRHWAMTPDGLTEWLGDVDPPYGAPVVRAEDPAPDVPSSRPATACLAVAQLPALACIDQDHVRVMGTLLATGDTNTFHLTVPASGVGVSMDLVDLPADYDLYFADASGTILAQSNQEGTVPEHVAMSVPGGDYVVYVHSDPGRPVDSQNPYRLELSLTPS